MKRNEHYMQIWFYLTAGKLGCLGETNTCSQIVTFLTNPSIIQSSVCRFHQNTASFLIVMCFLGNRALLESQEVWCQLSGFPRWRPGIAAWSSSASHSLSCPPPACPSFFSGTTRRMLLTSRREEEGNSASLWCASCPLALQPLRAQGGTGVDSPVTAVSPPSERWAPCSALAGIFHCS